MHEGKKIKEYLRLQYITPRELADKLDKNEASVYRMFKKEKIRTGKLKEIAQALHVDIKDIFEYEGVSERSEIYKTKYDRLKEKYRRLLEQHVELQDKIIELQEEINRLKKK